MYVFRQAQHDRTELNMTEGCQPKPVEGSSGIESDSLIAQQVRITSFKKIHHLPIALKRFITKFFPLL